MRAPNARAKNIVVFLIFSQLNIIFYKKTNLIYRFPGFFLLFPGLPGHCAHPELQKVTDAWPVSQRLAPMQIRI